MKRRSLTRAFSAAVATVLISSGLLVGAAATAQAEPEPPQDKDLVSCLLTLDLVNCLTGDSDLLGTGAVGQPLQLVQPVFGFLPANLLGLVDTDITWLCDGVEIPGTAGLTELVPTEALEGCQVAVETVTTLAGFLPLTLVTDLIGITGDGEEEPELPANLLSVLTQNPVLSGTGNVGEPLTVLEPVFGLLSPALQLLVDTDVTWLCNGEAIPGVGDVLQFIPTEAQAGCEIVAQTVSTLLGLVPLTLVTDLIQVPGGVVDAPKATTPASISGTPKVGQTLTITDPVWDTAGVTNSYTWLRNGTAIAGATAKTYKAVAADAGKLITAKVTGTKEGKSGTSVTNGLTILQDAVQELVATVAPHISGTSKVGSVLSIDPGTWLGGIVSPQFSYQWYNSKGAIPGATSREYVPTLADAGKPLAATVTATLVGFLDGLGITNVVKVSKAASKTKLRKAGAKLLSLRVTPAGAQPTGKVKLMKGAKVLKTIRIKAADNGRRTVKLPKLGKGTHKLRAVYKGNKSLKKSKSNVLRVKVG